MKPFDQLSSRGKAARLRPLAEAILAQYDLKVSGLRLVGLFTNALFRVFHYRRSLIPAENLRPPAGARMWT